MTTVGSNDTAYLHYRIFMAAAYPSLPEKTDINTVYFSIAKFAGFKNGEMRRRCRRRTIVKYRQICMWLIRKYTNLSLNEIGEFFGGYDHTSVLHSVRTVNDLATAYADYKNEIEVIEEYLRKERVNELTEKNREA